MKTYGYARVSTVKQNIERQVRNIKEQYPDAVMVQDAYTGTTLDRPNWKKLYNLLRPGDRIIFDEVSRMSRNAEDAMQLYEELFNRGIDLVFLKEPHVNSSVYREAGRKKIEIDLQSGSEPIDKFGNGMIGLINELLMDLAREQVRLAFVQAEKEVDYVHKRTKEGIETARLNGKQIGQKKGAKLITKKSVSAKEVIQKHSKDFGGTLSDTETMILAKCSRNSYYKYKKALKEHLGNKGDTYEQNRDD